MDIAGRVVVVTGAGSGLGAVLTRAFADAGAQVLVADRDAVAAGDTAAGVVADGGRATAVRCDVLLDPDLDGLVACADALGGADVLVNNAGGWGDLDAQYPDAPVEAWAAVLDLNLRAPMLAIQRFLPALRHRGGAVVNIASSAGVEDGPYRSPPYGAAKAGLVRLTTSLADLDGVRVTCVVPGWVGLPRAHAEWGALDPAERDVLPALVPPDHLAATVLDLVTADAPSGTVVECLEGTTTTLRAGGGPPGVSGGSWPPAR